MTEYDVEISNVLRDELAPMLEAALSGFNIRVVGYSIVINNDSGQDLASVRVYPDQHEMIVVDRRIAASFRYEYGDPNGFEKVVEKVKHIVR